MLNKSIIKTQWINNIINVSDISFRYVYFVISLKNDLFLHSTSYPSSSTNYFFGLKENGRPYFSISGEPSLISSISYSDSHDTKYNGVIVNLKTNDNELEKEYLMSIGKDYNFIEFFDLNNNEVLVNGRDIDFTGYTIRSKTYSILNIIENNKNYYLFTFIGKPCNSDNLYYVI